MAQLGRSKHNGGRTGLTTGACTGWRKLKGSEKEGRSLTASPERPRPTAAGGSARLLGKAQGQAGHPALPPRAPPLQNCRELPASLLATLGWHHVLLALPLSCLPPAETGGCFQASAPRSGSRTAWSDGPHRLPLEGAAQGRPGGWPTISDPHTAQQRQKAPGGQGEVLGPGACPRAARFCGGRRCSVRAGHRPPSRWAPRQGLPAR